MMKAPHKQRVSDRRPGRFPQMRHCFPSDGVLWITVACPKSPVRVTRVKPRLDVSEG